MKSPSFRYGALGFGLLAVMVGPLAVGMSDQSSAVPRAYLDGTGPGWKELGEDDFTDVNCEPDTWTWKDGVIHCTGQPVGVIRTQKPLTNFELVAEWKHLHSGGNSGIFVWAPEKVARGHQAQLAPARRHRSADPRPRLPRTIREKVRQERPTWFTTHGDVFAVGTSKMTPFPPVSPRRHRSFPSKRLSKGVGEWNHYYVRGINGEVRLWVNGEEVSGGTSCEPRTGFLCLESEGSPVEFRRLRLRELP